MGYLNHGVFALPHPIEDGASLLARVYTAKLQLTKELGVWID
jgi:hypothetical protein